MKYANIIPHWYNVHGTAILIDQRYALIGYYLPITNQIYRERIRQAEKATQEVKSITE